MKKPLGDARSPTDFDHDESGVRCVRCLCDRFEWNSGRWQFSLDQRRHFAGSHAGHVRQHANRVGWRQCFHDRCGYSLGRDGSGSNRDQRSSGPRDGPLRFLSLLIWYSEAPKGLTIVPEGSRSKADADHDESGVRCVRDLCDRFEWNSGRW